MIAKRHSLTSDQQLSLKTIVALLLLGEDDPRNSRKRLIETAHLTEDQADIIDQDLTLEIIGAVNREIESRQPGKELDKADDSESPEVVLFQRGPLTLTASTLSGGQAILAVDEIELAIPFAMRPEFMAVVGIIPIGLLSLLGIAAAKTWSVVAGLVGLLICCAIIWQIVRPPWYVTVSLRSGETIPPISVKNKREARELTAAISRLLLARLDRESEEAGE